MTNRRRSSFAYPLIYTLSLAHMGFSWRRDNTWAMSNTEQAAVQSGRQGDFLPPSRSQVGRAAHLVLYFPTCLPPEMFSHFKEILYTVQYDQQTYPSGLTS